MNISDWPLDKIMQLPDCAFGRRFLIAIDGQTLATDGGEFVSRTKLPDRAVLWELLFTTQHYFYTGKVGGTYWSIAFTPSPTLTATSVKEAEPLFPCQGMWYADKYQFTGLTHLVNLRMPFEAQSRYLCTDIVSLCDFVEWFTLHTIWSSVPKEVPDWLCSAIR